VRAFTGLGSYVATGSALHCLDAAAKIGLLAAFTAGLFMVDGLAGLAVFAAAVAIAVVVSRVPWSAALRGIRAVSLLLALTVLLNALVWRPATVALVRLGPVAIDPAGLERGLFFAVRIVVLVVGTTLLTLTTSPIEVASGLERVLAPLKVIRVPVAELAMTLTIALRFIPTTVEEAERVITAQSARGARFDEGGPFVRARAYVPVLVPMFFNLFRRADALATAMEARCYRGAEERTRLHEQRMGATDWATLLVAGSILVAAGVLL
jgi:energy-coupling factor transport system permease protein